MRPMRTIRLSALVLASLLGVALFLTAAADPPSEPYVPRIAPASDEGQKAIKRIRVPKELQIELFAAEPLLANPVAFCIDEKNRFYIAETFRLHDGVTDIRGHMNWLDDDLACRTVDDRVAMYRKYLAKNFDSYLKHHERVRLVEDADGDGKADRSTVFADGFHQAASGIGAGVLARRGNVWFTCIPDLWLLRDSTGKGQATERKLLSHGYGVHVGFLGHDLHGLIFGPDGKIYFSIGDRGLNVKTKERHLFSPDTGAVLRCNPDGSELELVATGLRNPQELAFDQYGNLFTGDNNSDGGDRARWVYVVEGGDSGWRIGYQFLNSPAARGPWNMEKMWHPAWDGQAAYLVPPIANVADGPSGLAYYPGQGLPERYDGHFFLADFRGGAGQSGIRSFAVKPKGASFELVDQHEFIWSVLATDVDFGMDGALYLSDWVDGWNKPNKGRLYKIFDKKQANSPALAEVKKLMAEGIGSLPIEKLTTLLAHKDMRVRQEAQFALAARNGEGVAPLCKVARESKNPLARLHAIWGLGQIARKTTFTPESEATLLALLSDADLHVRAQAARILGEGQRASAYDKLVSLLKDGEPRVRFFAAQSLGKLGRKSATPALLALLRENADRDPYLRHAAVHALATLDERKELLQAGKDENASVRLGALLALRRLQSDEVAHFLHDLDVRVAVEAARAINDVPIEGAQAQLASLLDTRQAAGAAWLQRTLEASKADPNKLTHALLWRVLNANFRQGTAAHANAVAAFATRSEVPAELRLEALRMLGDWSKPSGRDRIVGLWRPLKERSPQIAREAVRTHLAGLFTGSDEIRREGTKLAARLGIKEVGPALIELVRDKKRSAEVRVEALRALDSLKDKQLEAAMQVALTDAQPRLRNEGRRVLARLHPTEVVPQLQKILQEGDPLPGTPTPAQRQQADQIAQQGALALLGTLKDAQSEAILSAWLDKLLARQVPAELQLDLLEAAAARKAPALQAKLTRYDNARSKTDHLAKFREALAGGDAEAGRRLFLNKAEVYCLRCHKIQGQGGEVGPELTGIGAKQTREYLLEALVMPSKQIAKGFDTVVLTNTKGQVFVGVLKSEDAREIKLMTAEGKLVTVPKKEIDDRQVGKSAMPEDLVQKLSRTEIRDLVEFLSQLK